MNIEEVFKKVLDCSFRVHTALGPGLLKSAYEECLYYELIQLQHLNDGMKRVILSSVKIRHSFRRGGLGGIPLAPLW
jgi:GxxExxY protein